MTAGDATTSDIAVSVIIPTYNRAAVLAQTLGYLAQQSIPVAWEVVVVNNRCTDQTDAVVAGYTGSFFGRLRIVHEDKPGASAARNHGIRSARGPLLVFLDDDICLRDGALERALSDHLSHPTSWFVARILPLSEHLTTPFGLFRSACATAPAPVELFPEVETFASGFAVVPRASLSEIGGYNEAYPTAALEDADLFIRARRGGIRVFYDPELVGTHNDWAGTSVRDYCQRQRVYCRSAPLLRQSFGDEHHPWSALIAANSAPLWRSDGVKSFARKRVKSLLGRRIPMGVLFRTADILERSGRWRPVLWFVYRAAIAASMYAGYQEGLQAVSPLRSRR